MHPEKIIHSIPNKNVKKSVPCTGEIQYDSEYKFKDKSVGTTTIFLDPLVKYHKENKEIEKHGYKFYKIDKLTLLIYNSIRKINPIFYKNHIQKPMLMTKILQLIDMNLDDFIQWVCDFNCVKQPCYCKIENPVCRYVCYILCSRL